MLEMLDRKTRNLMRVISESLWLIHAVALCRAPGAAPNRHQRTSKPKQCTLLGGIHEIPLCDRRRLFFFIEPSGILCEGCVAKDSTGSLSLSSLANASEPNRLLSNVIGPRLLRICTCMSHIRHRQYALEC